MLKDSEQYHTFQLITNNAPQSNDAPTNSPAGKAPKRKLRCDKETGETRERAPTPIDESETALCEALWRAVILQALIDVSTESAKPEAKQVKYRALSWFNEGYSEGTSDFEEVCHLAGMDADYVRDRLKSALAEGSARTASRNFRCLRKGKPENRNIPFPGE